MFASWLYRRKTTFASQPRQVRTSQLFGYTLLHVLRQLGKYEPIAHIAKINYQALRQIGPEIDRDPRAAIGIVAGQHGVGILRPQLPDAIGIAFERE